MPVSGEETGESAVERYIRERGWYPVTPSYASWGYGGGGGWGGWTITMEQRWAWQEERARIWSEFKAKVPSWFSYLAPQVQEHYVQMGWAQREWIGLARAALWGWTGTYVPPRVRDYPTYADWDYWRKVGWTIPQRVEEKIIAPAKSAFFMPWGGRVGKTSRKDLVKELQRLVSQVKLQRGVG